MRNPYSWFNPLEALLNAAAGASYYKRSACHLDLVQWATVYRSKTSRVPSDLVFMRSARPPGSTR